MPNINNYPPNVAYYVDVDGNQVDVIDGPNQAIRVATIGSVGAGSDAFGRQRISAPFTLGDYKHLYGLDPNFTDYIISGATISFQPSAACARLSTAGVSNSRIVHQTKYYHHYMPGKSQTILSSFNFYSPVTNVVKRTGYFDDNNGIFLQQDGDGTLSFTIRSFVGGTVSNNKVTQANWNVDKCDGTGFSKFHIDITKTQLFFTDFQWLGVGRVRCGFVHDGDTIIAHEFYHSNNTPTVYMSTPNLPVRCEVVNGGTTSGGYMDQICSTVISEGGYVEAGQDWAVINPTLRSLAGGSTLPVIAIRLKNTFNGYDNRMIVKLGNFNVFTDSENIKYKLIKLNGISQLTGATWTDVGAGSGIEYSVNATAFTGGDEIDNGFAGAAVNGGNKAGGAPAAELPSNAKKNYIVQSYASNDSEIYVVAMTGLGPSNTTTNVGVGLQWREIY